MFLSEFVFFLDLFIYLFRKLVFCSDPTCRNLFGSRVHLSVIPSTCYECIYFYQLVILT